MNDIKIGKYICLILRHKPEIIGIELDKNGWANIDELINGVKKKYPDLNRERLEYIVKTDNKQRYSLSDDKSKIRARQGHSIDVDVELKELTPPELLYHGTAERFLESIMKEGLVPKSRLYVHLSKDVETAEKVGKRHGKPAVLKIETGKMAEDGFKFYLSENGVWLTKAVPPKYFSLI